MRGRGQDPSGFQLGDKVRIRLGVHAGKRGIVLRKADKSVEIEFAPNDIAIVPLEEVTNFSLAARRAWEAMPKRAGRPMSLGPRKKMVSLRLDVDLWTRLGEAAETGLIRSREQAVNDWTRERLDELLGSTTSDTEEE